jgi:hypothetical protein
MSRYNSNYGSHDQLQELRVLGMEVMRERDRLQIELTKWQGLARMMSHFDICTSARIECNICAEARQAYLEALSQ